MLVGLPLAALIGPSPLHSLTLCGPERVLVLSTEPPDDLSCLTPGVGRPGDGAVARAVAQGGEGEGRTWSRCDPPPNHLSKLWGGGGEPGVRGGGIKVRPRRMGIKMIGVLRCSGSGTRSVDVTGA